MASIVGGSFDPIENQNIDAEQSTLIRDFLDRIGVSEGAIETVAIESSDNSSGIENLQPFVISEATPAATVLAPDGEQISISLDPESAAGQILIVQGVGDALITGGSGGDKVHAGSGDDLVRGGVGSDYLAGGLGDDIIYGNTESDTLFAGDGADSLFGGQGEDCISGGDDSDFLMGNKGADIVYGNTGDDIIYGNQQNDVVYGGAGSDTLYGGQNDDTLEGGRGDDVLHGNLGGDQFVFRTNSGVDVIYDFVAGTDTIRVANGINGLSVAEPGDLASRISSDAQGNAVIDFGNGNVVTIDGLSANDLLGDISSFISVG
ncbi:calcium-binding protein [Nisaea sp.]|uniref:calcium-binding protein n=1 Tax=Nisaea sp. TaxID=2024842 RepID=UPI003299A15D